MLSFIEGIVAGIGEDGKLSVKIGSIGVEVVMPSTSAMGLEVGEEVRLYTHLLINPQDGNISLFAFLQPVEKEIFKHLLKCHGVGPKVALALLDMGASRLITAIENEDFHALSGVSGVGTKTAQKIAIELKGKFTKLMSEISETAGTQAVKDEATAALKALGFRENEISSAISALRRKGQIPEDITVDELLKLLLVELG